jgi:hypothetical protein
VAFASNKLASRRFVWWFCVFALAHCVLFVAVPFSFASFDHRVAWFYVNTLPWYPLHAMGLPVTTFGWLTLPNAVGWVWCGAVWLGFYVLLAQAAAFLASHRGGHPRVSDDPH